MYLNDLNRKMNDVNVGVPHGRIRKLMFLFDANFKIINRNNHNGQNFRLVRSD